jgi:DNA-binding CsgD family transcriptional regulator
MPPLRRNDVSGIEAFERGLADVRLDDASGWEDLMAGLLDFSDAAFTAVYRVAHVDGDLAVEFLRGAGRTPPDSPVPFRDALRDYFLANGRPAVLYEPQPPDRCQRNRVLCPTTLMAPDADLETHPATTFGRTWGFHPDGQVRALLCDGPLLLGWFGGAWPVTEVRRATGILKALVPAVRERLLTDRALGHGPLLTAALDATLEALGVAAYIVRRQAGRLEIEVANTAGAAALDRDPVGSRKELGLAFSAPSCCSRFRIQHLVGRGLPAEYYLVMEHRPVGPGLRARAASDRFGFTPRQSAVLELLLLGHTNRTISELLGCAEGTVELHVSAMLDKCGADTRSQLAARIWMLDDG